MIKGNKIRREGGGCRGLFLSNRRVVTLAAIAADATHSSWPSLIQPLSQTTVIHTGSHNSEIHIHVTRPLSTVVYTNVTK